MYYIALREQRVKQRSATLEMLFVAGQRERNSSSNSANKDCSRVTGTPLQLNVCLALIKA